MKCPSCGNEQSDGWLSCQKCHVIFSRWQPGAGSDSARPPASPAASVKPGATIIDPVRQASMFSGPAPQPARSLEAAAIPPAGRSLSWLVYLLLMIPFALALYLLLNPKGRPVEPGSYQDLPNAFAIRAPEGWLTLNRENFDALMNQYGTQLPASLADNINSSSLAVSIVRLSPGGEFSPSMNVVIVNKPPPPINEKSKLEAAKAIAGGFADKFPDYQQESVRLIEVDKLRSLEIVSTASLPFQFSSASRTSRLTLRYRQVFVPGKKRAYILTFTVLKDAGDDAAAEFQGVLDSFRILKRPPHFSPVLNGALIGGLIAALFFLFNAMLLSLGGQHVK
jgi:hypothetical protein